MTAGCPTSRRECLCARVGPDPAQTEREVTPALYGPSTSTTTRPARIQELDEYLRAYYGQPLDVMRYVQAIRGGSAVECLDWLARYVDAGARHLIVRIGSIHPRPESLAEQLLPALKELNNMTEIPDAETMKAFNKGIVEEFRANGGVVGGPFEGGTLLLLTSTGAKSGQPRLAPLAYLTIDGKMFIIGSKAGLDTNPDWVHNLRANPTAHIEVGTDRMTSPPASCRPKSGTRRGRRSSHSRPASVTTRPTPAASYRCSNCSGHRPEFPKTPADRRCNTQD